MRIFLIRHGESQGNVDPQAYVDCGDPQVPLTDRGWRQALAAGAFLTAYLTEHDLPAPQRFWVSSFLRTRETLSGVLEGMDADSWDSPPAIRSDLRLAEQSFGYLPYMQKEKGLFRRAVGRALSDFSRAVHKGNPFLAVPPMGEAPMTSYKRVDSFLGTLHREQEKRGIENIVIVSHGATIKNFMMRWFHVPLDGWPKLKTPGNTDIFMLDDDSGPWQITRIYDGEKGIPVHDDPLKDVEWLRKDNLPPVPDFLKRKP